MVRVGADQGYDNNARSKSIYFCNIGSQFLAIKLVYLSQTLRQLPIAFSLKMIIFIGGYRQIKRPSDSGLFFWTFCRQSKPTRACLKTLSFWNIPWVFFVACLSFSGIPMVFLEYLDSLLPCVYLCIPKSKLNLCTKTCYWTCYLVFKGEIAFI